MSSAEAFVRIHQLLAVKRIMHAGLLWLHRGLADWESVADHEVLGVHGVRTSDPNLFASVRASLQQAQSRVVPIIGIVAPDKKAASSPPPERSFQA
ncbi:hypothetical protein M413DRAFT_281099 [Hebeloma cylindrosporum]|uniref:Uncharacterized protein n=1 Tax=Hebeloma cylindrosporum TaxID=76867 RepID=A0A0C2XGP2_HEBCY|nr:hypothetical protein M413DRAFT_281099 [Hebeloma cylindrosporum h7]